MRSAEKDATAKIQNDAMTMPQQSADKFRAELETAGAWAKRLYSEWKPSVTGASRGSPDAA